MYDTHVQTGIQSNPSHTIPHNKKNPMTITRRRILTTAAAAAVLPLSPALASAPLLGQFQATHRRIRLGAFEVTTLLAATKNIPGPHDIFGLNVDAETFNAAAAASNLPTDVAKFFFTPTLVNTGKELILFDTGIEAGGLTAALNAAGYSADQVDIVVITHMHPDHIGGLMQNGKPTFINARYVTGEVEFDSWAGSSNADFESNVRPLADRMTFLKDGGSVVSGVTAMAAFGHTPGHMVYMLESNGAALMIAADFANHYVWSLAHPDWEVKFDLDKAAAAKTRRYLLDMLSTDHIPFIGYHMPWPAIGYVAAHGNDSFVYVPNSYQLDL